jgi:acetyl-CoA carboxylase carboxyltransferase component
MTEETAPAHDPRRSWIEAVQEIEQRREFAAEMGGPERIARQHVQGKLTIRERIERFLDPGSFFEIGGMVGEGEYDDQRRLTGFKPGAYVMGTGTVAGRPLCVGGEDFTISGGSGGAHKGPADFIQPFAREYRIPLVQFADGAGASAKSYEDAGRMHLPDGKMWALDVDLLASVPVVSAVMGPAAGHVAGRAVLAHFSVMVKGQGQIFASGPPVVKRALGEDVTKEELGGTDIHVRQSGVIDNEAKDEEDAFRQIREFLSFLPPNVWEAPPRGPITDGPDRREERLLSIIPKERTRAYDMRELIRLVVDDGHFFEMRPYFGGSLITAFARMHGYPVGVIANNPKVGAGALTAQAADKHTHFVDLCNAFNIPVVAFVDVPGFMIGTAAERTGLMRAGMRAVVAGVQARVPHIAIQVRKSYGMAGDAVSCLGGGGSLNLRFGWPSGEWGSIPIEGGVAAAYRRVIESAPDPEAMRLEIEQRMQANRSAFRVAEAFEILDIIDPRATRPIICRFVETAQPLLRQLAGPKGAVRP